MAVARSAVGHSTASPAFGKAQLAVHQLLVENQLEYQDLKKAIIQRFSQIPEHQCQRFKGSWPFMFAQQIWDACRRLLLSEEKGINGILDQVVLEQLTTGTVEWIQCHHQAEAYPLSLSRSLFHHTSIYRITVQSENIGTAP